MVEVLTLLFLPTKEGFLANYHFVAPLLWIVALPILLIGPSANAGVCKHLLASLPENGGAGGGYVGNGLSIPGKERWYQRYEVEDYVLSFTGTPATNPTRVVTHSYYSEKFLTRSTEIKQTGFRSLQVEKALAEKGMAHDALGRTIFTGSSYKQCKERVCELMDAEGAIMRALSEEGWGRYHAEIDRRLDFAFEEYPKDWPGEFLDFLRKSAHHWDNAMHSNYVEVFELTPSGLAGNQVGVFLNISHPFLSYERLVDQKLSYTAGAPARRLTVEDFLGEELPLPHVRLPDDSYVLSKKESGMQKFGGVKSEPRNWRIKQGVSPKVFGEILLQYVNVLVNSSQSQYFGEEGNYIYTYGPRQSVIRYTGIDPVTGRKSKRGGLGFEMLSPKTVVKHGIEWWTLKSTPAKMRERLLNIESTRGWTQQDADDIRSAFSSLSAGEWQTAGPTSVTPPY